MSTRKQYWVRQETNQWAVKEGTQVLSTHTAKSDAVTAGVKVASANQPSSLRICRMDGTIEDERTYGDDPYPPRG